MGKKIANVFGILAAIILSLVLLCMLVVTPVVSAATSLTQEKTLHNIVESIDFTELDLFDEGNPAAALLDTQFMRELLKLYVEDLMAELDGTGEDFLTTDALTALTQEHMDELIPFLHEVAEDPEYLVPDDELSKELMNFVQQNGQQLLDEFPTLEELGVTHEVVETIAVLRSKIVLKVLSIIAIILSLLVYACRWPRFKGFMWLAVVYLLGAIPVGLVSVSLGTLVPGLLPAELTALSGVVNPVLSAVTGTLNTAFLIYVGITVVFTLIFIFGRKALRKKAAQAEASVEEI